VEFVSATPAVIGLKGSGQTEVSVIVFNLKDINGKPVADGTAVSFSMSGPSGGKLPDNGGEYIGDLDSTPTQATGSTASGSVSVNLHSGSVSGIVRITASTDIGSGTTISAVSTAVSIGGGIPSAAHFTVSTDQYNLAGLAFVNKTANITATLADRFGNYNVLTGTSVSFYAESGAVNRSATTDAKGIATSPFRTQAPDPAHVDCQAWETSLITTLNARYGLAVPACTKDTAHPRNGWASIMVAVRGEEAFDDRNGNGIYDAGEPFTDTQQEAYIDKDDSGARNDGTGSAPFEEFIDDNGNGSYDGANGVWDSNKTIFQNITLLITGGPTYIRFDTAGGFNIPNGSSKTFRVLVADANLNPLSSGSTVTISSTAGTLTGLISYTFPNAFQQGPTELTVVLSDSDTATVLAAPATITVTVTWEGGNYVSSISGTVN
jgi:adhesin/invasin